MASNMSAEARRALAHLIEHVHEGRQPVRLVVGRDVPEHVCAAMRREAVKRHLRFAVCVDPTCGDPLHLTLETAPAE